jgi:phosphoglycolate phosphatase-like HAD superfamily hydrolase
VQHAPSEQRASMPDVLHDPTLRPLYERARCVFLDCDGVIFDSNAFKIEAMRRTLEGYPTAEVEEMAAFWRANGGASRFAKFEHFYTHIAPRRDVRGEVAAAAQRFGSLARAAYDHVQPLQAALEFARATGAERCHVVSGAAELELESVFASKGITSLFASIQGSPRPKLELVQRVLQQQRCPAQEALLIGDGSMDFRVSQQLGLHFVYLAEFSEWTGAQEALAGAPSLSVAASWADLLQALFG